MIDLFQLTAEKRYNVPSGWKWCFLNVHNIPKEYVEVKGAVPIGVYKSGPAKGRPKFPRTADLLTIWMKQTDIDAVAIEWESENDACHKCEGKGESQFSWSRTDGSQYRKCTHCNGTGKPVAKKDNAA